MTSFPTLFSPIDVGPITLRNRIVSTGHHTHLADGAPTPELIAYHTARAKGGTGLIVTEVTSVHDSGAQFADLLSARPENTRAFAALADSVAEHGTRIFAQLFHPGREVMFTADGMGAVAYAPSAVPNERFHIMPREMPTRLIEEIVESFGKGASLMAEAGYDGVEIVASHGYLPAQFLNPQTNRRSDAWGGSFDNRLSFTRRILDVCRAAAPDLALGLRLSGDDMDGAEMSANDWIEVAAALAPDLDYLSVTAGTSASLGGSVHITPPMGLAHGYTAPLARSIRARVKIPVIVTGRINQPQFAESILAEGDADLCGMTRALITDCDMPRKAQVGRADDIRACIGCNQSCIGRAHKGLGISCIQRPESGRETEYTTPNSASNPKNVIVVGGGPAGLKAASVLAARGHETQLWEAEAHLGGQVHLAARLPGREDFGGLIENLKREIHPGVTIRMSQCATAESLADANPDCVILATGARPYRPRIETSGNPHILDPWQILEGKKPATRVIIADWKADWIGLGLAEKLARNGHDVRLRVNAAMPGESLQLYTRNHMLGRLYRLGIDMKPNMRLYGADNDTVYFQNTLTGDPVVEDGCGTLILATGHQPCDTLAKALHDAPFDVHLIGDALAARTAEEAVYEGLKLAWTI